jgi:starch synthase
MIYRGGTFEGEQYAYFCRAVLEALHFADFIPDIIHVNDWHTAMMPMLIKTQYQSRSIRNCKTVLAMHSLGYQGRFDFGFASELLAIDSRYNTPDYFEYYGGVNFMKAGIVFADKLVTVSPTYAEEIRTPYYGEGLDGILNTRADDLVGILNGIDTKIFNPGTDDLIEKSYDENSLDDKQENKKALIEQLGLKIDADKPLIGMVTRLTKQKGLDLVMRVMNDIMEEGAGFVLLGTGDADYENFFRDAWHAFSGRANGMIMFDEALAHKIYAGCDFFLMPSQFEPCGLSQIIALRYGTLPIVRETGGLKDTVKPYNQHTGEGDGFSFVNYNAHEMLDTIRYALRVYNDKDAFRALQKHAMEKDLSFDKSALAYGALYLVTLDEKDTQD